MSLRAATEADLPFVAAIQARPDLMAMIGTDTPQGLRDYLAHPDYRLLIWQPDAAALGFAVLHQAPANPGRVELKRLALVEPGRGEGARLLAALVAQVFADPANRRFWLDVAADNLRARRAYERAGFRLEGVLRAHWLRRTGDWADLALYGMLATERRAPGA